MQALRPAGYTCPTRAPPDFVSAGGVECSRRGGLSFAPGVLPQKNLRVGNFPELYRWISNHTAIQRPVAVRLAVILYSISGRRRDSYENVSKS